MVLRVEEDHTGRAWLVTRQLSSSALEPEQTLALEDVECGFKRGEHVELERQFGTEAPLRGEIQGLTMVAGQALAIVRDFERGELKSLPYELLRLIHNPYALYVFGERARTHAGAPHGAPLCSPAEAMRLRVLAHALERWNQNTGALSRLEIDPLPHQLQLVDEILQSGDLNWMIADDVGLGKTIEVGMLLRALHARNPNLRVLIVTPSGLTRQWQEELAEKFDLRDFLIYGDDFHIRSPDRWRAHSSVIASVDRAKHDHHLPILEASGHWDLVLFDEAHRLTRREYGAKTAESQRYALARTLREQTSAMMLLTATPHQGRTDQFRALLTLLRPEHAAQFDALEQHPELLGEMIYRNRKSHVTDAEGRRIFKGQSTHRYDVAMTEEELTFDELLQDYFRQCGERARELGGSFGQSIGFVMTTFRKLSASSHAAIHRALGRRLDTLRGIESDLEEERARLDAGDLSEAFLQHLGAGDGASMGQGALASSDELALTRFAGEVEEYIATRRSASSFFDGEERELAALISMLAPLIKEDSKLDTFLRDIFDEVRQKEGSKKLLVFTEFRATQTHLQRAIAARIGEERVGLIHGGMTTQERRAIVHRFGAGVGDHERLEVVISTEAGGEGLNLHEDCHVLVNYDLPWNPMRIVQRVGRLYRYGQRHPVVVFNLQSSGTLDGHVVARLQERIESVVRDLGEWSKDYDEQLEEEILGQLLEQVDGRRVADLFDRDAVADTDAANEGIEEVVAEARERYKAQSELLQFARHFDPSRAKRGLQLGHAHLDTFVSSMLAALGCAITARQHDDKVWSVRLSERVASALGMRQESVVRLTTHRTLRRRPGRDVRMMDFNDPLFLLLIRAAREDAFGGQAAHVDLVDTALAGDELLLFARALWQDGRGAFAREEIVALSVDGATLEVHLNARAHADWLATSARHDPSPAPLDDAERALRRSLTDKARRALDDYIRAHSNARQLPMCSHPLSFGVARR